MFSIRVAATDNLKRLTEHFGTQWAREHIFPKVRPRCIALPRSWLKKTEQEGRDEIPYDVCASACARVCVRVCVWVFVSEKYVYMLRKRFLRATNDGEFFFFFLLRYCM